LLPAFHYHEAAVLNCVFRQNSVGARKTALFHQLAHVELRETHTSAKETEARCVPTQADGKSEGKEFCFVDFPGHGYVSSTRAVVLVIDASVDVVKLQVVAQILFSLLADSSIAKRKVPILLALNKTDLPNCSSGDQT
jgi:translation initiation factor IF-2